jgi:hypothetical protein
MSLGGGDISAAHLGAKAAPGTRTEDRAREMVAAPGKDRDN